jgi:hypothetical protein
MNGARIGARNSAVIAAFALLSAACVVEHTYSPPPTEIEFDEVRNLGYACGGPLASWKVTRRDNGDTGTAGCEQPILFTALAPNANYVFDIEGSDANGRVCWQGSCSVTTIGGERSYADCSAEIQRLCGF